MMTATTIADRLRALSVADDASKELVIEYNDAFSAFHPSCIQFSFHFIHSFLSARFSFPLRLLVWAWAPVVSLTKPCFTGWCWRASPCLASLALLCFWLFFSRWSAHFPFMHTPVRIFIFYFTLFHSNSLQSARGRVIETRIFTAGALLALSTVLSLPSLNFPQSLLLWFLQPTTVSSSIR